MRTGGVDPSRMWRKKRSPKPKLKKAKPKLQAPSHSVLDTHDGRAPVKETYYESEETAEKIDDVEAKIEEDKDNESNKVNEDIKTAEENGDEGTVSKELAEEVDRVNTQVIFFKIIIS